MKSLMMKEISWKCEPLSDSRTCFGLASLTTGKSRGNVRGFVMGKDPNALTMQSLDRAIRVLDIVSEGDGVSLTRINAVSLPRCRSRAQGAYIVD
jgi:hypothetical protein